MKRIFSLGTGNRTLTELAEILEFYSIRLLIDVRRFPTSRFDHFKKENLCSFCSTRGIAYQWMGDLLGGFRSDSYGHYMRTDAFRRGLDLLDKLAQSQVTAFCCAERLPWKCHRRFIASQLEGKSWQVIHIMDWDRVWVRGNK